MEDNEQDLMSLFSSNDFELNMDLNQEDIDLLQGNDDDSEEAQEELSEDETNDELGEDDENPEEVGENEDSKEEGTDEDETSPNIYSSFASVLSEQGLLPSLELQNQKIETPEDLTTAIRSEISNQTKEYLINKLGEDGYDALEKGVSLSEYQQHKTTTENLEGLNEDILAEDLELSKRIILQDYLNQGIDEARAMRILKKSIDLGEESVIEDAKESLESLKVFESKRLEQVKIANQARQEADLKQQEQIDNDLKNAIYNSKEFIKDIKVNKAMQDKVYQSITQVVGQSPSGVAENKLMQDRRENPIDFDTKLYYLYEVTNGFKDFSKIMSKTESKVLTNFEKSLRQTKFEDSGKPDFLSDPESYGSMGTELVL